MYKYSTLLMALYSLLCRASENGVMTLTYQVRGSSAQEWIKTNDCKKFYHVKCLNSLKTKRGSQVPDARSAYLLRWIAAGAHLLNKYTVPESRLSPAASSVFIFFVLGTRKIKSSFDDVVSTRFYQKMRLHYTFDAHHKDNSTIVASINDKLLHKLCDSTTLNEMAVFFEHEKALLKKIIRHSPHYSNSNTQEDWLLFEQEAGFYATFLEGYGLANDTKQ